MVESQDFIRKLSVEFVENGDCIKNKTSKAKKTLRGLISFFNERCKIEITYANSLANLAKTAGAGALSYSLLEYKNHEESTVKAALNALVNSTFQESESHKNFAQLLKQDAISCLDDTRKDLSANKRAWSNKVDFLKK